MSGWTLEKVKSEALNYVNKYHFRLGSPEAYRVAWWNKWLGQVVYGTIDIVKRNKIVNRATGEKRTRSPRWTLERVAVEAAKYSISKDFKKGSPGAYQAAQRNDWLVKLFK